MDKTQSGAPVDLLPPPFNVTAAVIDSFEIGQMIERKILEKAVPFILTYLFSQICPGVSSKPQAALENIRQEVTDEAGNKTILPVATYHLQFMNAIRPFAALPVWPIDAHTEWVSRLEENTRKVLERDYTAHRDTVQPRTRREQLKLLADVLKAAQLAEQQLDSFRSIAHEQITATQLLTRVGTPALASQAERTLQQYGKNSGKTRKPKVKRACFGCGEEGHMWESRDGKTILCPHAHKPGIQEAAERAYEKYREDMKRRGRGKRVRYDDMSAEDKEKVAQQYATRVAEGKEVPSSLTVSSTVSAASLVTSPSRAHIFVVTAQAQPLVLQSGAVAPLPINIYS